MFVRHLENQKIRYNREIKLTRQGNIFEIMAYDRKSKGNDIIKIDSDHYYDFSEPIFNPDGEVIDQSRLDLLHATRGLEIPFYVAENNYVYEMRDYIKTVNRSEGPNELRKTFKRIRSIINTNVTDVRKCKFITLTYAENMTDTEQLKKDLSAFNKRFKRYIKSLCDDKGKNKELDFEYISVCEPQGRGAWHAHIIYIFNKQIQFIKNSEVERIWKSGNSDTKRGFTTTRKIDNVDNVGAYLTAYLADMELPDDEKISHEQLQFTRNKAEIKEIYVPEYDDFGYFKTKKKKRFVKGGRLHLYPSGFHIYRCSRGIKRPSSEYVKYGDALNEIGINASLTYAHTVELSDGQNYKNKLTYEFYNIKRKPKRSDSRTSYQKLIDCAAQFNENFHYVEIPREMSEAEFNYHYNTASIILELADYDRKYKNKINYV